MKKRFYEVREITCPMCEGLGVYDTDLGYSTVLLEDDDDTYEDLEGEYLEVNITCPKCKGNGYIDNTKMEGKSIYSDSEINFVEQHYLDTEEAIVKPFNLDDLGGAIAEYYNIEEYQILEGDDNSPYRFQYGNLYMSFNLKDIATVDDDAKYLIPYAFQYQGLDNYVYAVVHKVYMLQELGTVSNV